MTMKRALSALPENDFDDEALDWLVRQQDGLTPAESLALEQWLAKDTRHRAAYEHWQDDWSTLDLATPEDIAQLKQHLAADIALEQTTQARETSQQAQSTTTSWWQRLASRPVLRRSLAAALFTVCGTSVVIWYQLHHYAFNETYVTAQGQQIDVVLPDDSHIWLDTATQAQVSLTRTHRQVILPEGQMVFHVQGDEARPFDVLAGNTRITVVGTRFSVRYTPDIANNNQVQVTVEEGRVHVAPTDQPAAAIALTAGQFVDVASNGTLGKIETLTDTDIGLWRNKRISFDNIPLSQALTEFDRYAPPRLHILDQKVASMRITGTFDPTNLDNFMRVLPRVLPVALLEQNGQTVIVRK